MLCYLKLLFNTDELEIPKLFADQNYYRYVNLIKESFKSIERQRGCDFAYSTTYFRPVRIEAYVCKSFVADINRFYRQELTLDPKLTAIFLLLFAHFWVRYMSK